MTASKIQIRVFFDAGSGICFWAGNDAARTLYQEYLGFKPEVRGTN